MCGIISDIDFEPPRSDEETTRLKSMWTTNNILLKSNEMDEWSCVFLCTRHTWIVWLTRGVIKNMPITQSRRSMWQPVGFRHLVSDSRRCQRWDRTYYRSSICHYSELCIQVNVDQLDVGVAWLRIVVPRQVECRIRQDAEAEVTKSSCLSQPSSWAPYMNVDEGKTDEEMDHQRTDSTKVPNDNDFRRRLVNSSFISPITSRHCSTIHAKNQSRFYHRKQLYVVINSDRKILCHHFREN